jgi:hypothetical protein
MSSIVFLLGAGASVDAGMPLVGEVTQELRDRLSEVRDINLNFSTEFRELFDAVSEYEPGICSNYERFFEWLRFLRQGQTGSFARAVKFSLRQRLLRAVFDLEFKIKMPIWETLRDRHLHAGYRPDYFSFFGNFLPARGCLKVFTTNFDLCVEDACRPAGFKVNTGFSLRTGC